MNLEDLVFLKSKVNSLSERLLNLEHQFEIYFKDEIYQILSRFESRLEEVEKYIKELEAERELEELRKEINLNNMRQYMKLKTKGGKYDLHNWPEEKEKE